MPIDRPSTVDQVVFACHGDEVLPLLAEATDAERDVFSRFRTSRNETWLHTDERFLPRRPAARASWNYLIGGGRTAATVTYHLNRLQATGPIAGAAELLRHAEPTRPDRPGPRPGAYDLHSPALHAGGRRRADALGRRERPTSDPLRGAYWFYGFHEDGVRSAVRVAKALGVAMVDGAALYVGRLRHRRFTPRPHAFTYALFMALVDIDRIDEQMRVSRLTSVNRFNWASFDDRDHLGDPSRPLRERLRADADAHGVVLPDGPIYLLTHLRYLGYNFNPISFYYCCSATGRLETVLAEVHNTFGELRTYWLPSADGQRTATTIRHRAEKTMHVSPFMTMDVDYEFAVTAPGASLVAHMNTFRRTEAGSAPFFDATLTLEAPAVDGGDNSAACWPATRG